MSPKNFQMKQKNKCFHFICCLMNGGYSILFYIFLVTHMIFGHFKQHSTSFVFDCKLHLSVWWWCMTEGRAATILRWRITRYGRLSWTGISLIITGPSSRAASRPATKAPTTPKTTHAHTWEDENQQQAPAYGTMTEVREMGTYWNMITPRGKLKQG